MSRHILAIERGPGALTAVWGALPAPTLPTAKEPRPELAAFVLARAPLDAAEARAQAPLAAAWAALAAARLDANTLFHALTVAIATLPMPSAAALPSLPLEPVPPRATAAHPRAFRGTHARPPRPPRPPALGRLDLRPYVADRGGLARLRVRLAEHWPLVRARLRAQGLDGARLDRLGDDGVEPYFAYHHGAAPPARLLTPPIQPVSARRFNASDAKSRARCRRGL